MIEFNLTRELPGVWREESAFPPHTSR